MRHTAKVLLTGGLIPALVMPVSAVADTGRLEEVVVSARKLQENSQDTPLSLAVFSESDLQRRGIASVADLFASVPNLSIRQMPSSKSTLRVYIRGVGNNDAQITMDPAIAVYMDGVYIARSTGLSSEIADLERMEVLRGPQGALYGRNATGGAINLVTKRPAGEFGFRQQVSIGSRDYWKSLTRVSLDQIGGIKPEITVLKSSIDGDVKNKGSGPNFGDNRQTGARFALAYDESDVFNAFYSFEYNDIEYGAEYNQTLARPNPGYEGIPFSKDKITRVTPSLALDSSELVVRGHNLTLDFDLGWAQLKSITGYREFKEYYVQDYSANPSTLRLFANNPYRLEHEQLTHEFQLSGSLANSSLNYIVGLFYFDEEATQAGNDILGLNLGGGVQEFNLQSSVVAAENTAYAAFSQVSWTPDILQQKLTLTGGARYTRDKRKVDASRFNSFDTVTFDGIAAEETFSRPSFSAGMTYNHSDTLMLYGKYDQGYRTGGFNGRATTANGIVQVVDEETIDSFELGFKSDWLDGRLRFNTSVFIMAYDDLQLTFQVAAGDTRLFNAGKADISGAEVEIKYMPLPGLTISANLATLDYDLKDVVNPISGEMSDAGYVLTSSPKKTADTEISYLFAMPGLGDVTASLSYQWRDKSYTATNTLVAPSAYIPSHGIVNARFNIARLPITQKGAVGVDIWARNLADKEYLTDVIGSFHWSNRVGIFGEPRTFGMDVTYTY